MTAALDPVLLALSPFKVVNGGVMPFGKSGTAVIDAHHLGDRQPNPAMVQLHRDVVGALMPFVHPDCDFTPHESLGDRFHAHLTLMTGDVPKGLGAEMLAYLREAEPIGPPAFMAERCHLVAVRSENWHGRWWVNMRWNPLHSWLLGGESQPVAAPAWNTPS